MTAPSTQVTSLLTQFGLTTAAEELVPRLTEAGHPEAMPVLVEVFEAVSTVIQNSPTCGHRKLPHPLVVKNDETSACGGCGQAVCGLSKALWARLRVHIAGSVHRLPALTLPLWSA